MCQRPALLCRNETKPHVAWAFGKVTTISRDIISSVPRFIKIDVTLDVQRIFRCTGFVIVSFREKETAAFAAGKRVKAFSGIERAPRLKLDRLESALTLSDLAVLPGNRFEALKGSRKGQYSIRVNDQWRVCFEWPERSPGPANVEIVDYPRLPVGKERRKERTCHCSRSIPENIWPRN